MELDGDLEIEDTFKLLDSDEETLTDTETWTLFDSEKEFKKKYCHALDDERERLSKEETKIRARYEKEIEELTGSLTADDLLCKEDIEKIEMGPKMPEKYGITYCDMKAYYLMKNAWIQYFTPELYKGYYRGNMAMARCQKCQFVTDAWPCKEKRNYHMPEEYCGFCEKRLKLQDDGERKAYENTRPRPDWSFYQCR